MTNYPNIEAFYSEDERRRTSGEADYGVHWIGDAGGRSLRWRVSYIQATGEIYAVQHGGPVKVLGIVPSDPQTHHGERYYYTLDRILLGWAEGGNKPLSWVSERLQSF